MSYILGEEEKLSPEEAIEHYGVKGMKWGVRKDRSNVVKKRKVGRTSSKEARKAISDIGGTPHRGVGKRAAWNGMRDGKDIRKARVKVRAAKAEMKKLEKKVSDSKTPAEKAKAVKELTKARAEWDRSNDRVISAQLTGGETAVIGLLALPVTATGVGAGAVALSAATVSQLRSQKIQNKRWNIDQAEFMKGRTYKEIEKESLKSIKKAARKG